MKQKTCSKVYSVALVLGMLAPSYGLVACGGEPPPEPADVEESDELGESAAALGAAEPMCSTAGSSGFNTTTKALSITMSTAALTIGVVRGYVTVNGNTCVDATGKKLTPTDLKKIAITGSGADERVVVDLLTGAFGTTIFGATGGFTVDLAGGADSFSVRGSGGADKVTAGYASGGATDVYYELTGDKAADIKVSGTESHSLSLGAGDDTFSGVGGAISAAHLTPAVTALIKLPSTVAVTVYGGAGNDTLQGGDGDDTLNGGDGADTFKSAAAADGADVYVGGAGVDTMDYSLRTAALTVDLDGTGDDGDAAANAGAGELDNVGADVENLTGGTGNDTLTGSNVSNAIKGGAGDDVISGGANAGACSGDVDVLEGGAGSDRFDMGAAADCGDSVSGGDGKDTVDYQGRSAALVITVDGVANDGVTGELDNVKTDVEVVVGGSGNDTISGGAGADELHGGPGTDTLNGLAGDDVLYGNTGADTLNGGDGADTFVAGDVDAVYTVAEDADAVGSADVMNGGAGVDTVDYSARSAALTVSLCVDATKATGNTSQTTLGCGAANADGESGEGDEIINVEWVKGGTDDDTITGSTADETFEGGAGDDTINGGTGDDTLYGDAGDDTLNGDAGDDYIDDTVGTNVIDGGAGDGDICIGQASYTPVACEL
jgi:Ca2+-binding RTX toxin-like protein